MLLASANPDEILAGKLARARRRRPAADRRVAGRCSFVAGLGAVPLLFASQSRCRGARLLVALPLFIVAFLFFGSLMLGTGSLGSNMREAQQLSMVWSLTAALPLMMMAALLREPHGVVARVITGCRSRPAR